MFRATCPATIRQNVRWQGLFFRPASRTLVQKFWSRDNIFVALRFGQPKRHHVNSVLETIGPQKCYHVTRIFEPRTKNNGPWSGPKKVLIYGLLRRIVILAGPDFARDFFVPFRLIPPLFPRMIQTVQEINSTLFSSCAIISPIRAYTKQCLPQILSHWNLRCVTTVKINNI